MGKLFNIESPLIQGMNKVADLMWLNILVLFCSLPIFTIGASLTAAHYVALKMHRNEEGYITKDFFRAFKSNFRQSTIVWLLMMLVAVILGFDYYLILENMIEVPYLLRVVIFAATFIFAFMLMWIFPMQAKFENSISRTIKNSFAVALMKFPRSILMLILYVIPWLIVWLSIRAIPLFLVFGVSVPIYFSVMLYNKFFKKLENNVMERIDAEGNTEDHAEEKADDTERIFSDKPLIRGEDDYQSGKKKDGK
ncbi:MAG TPA: DUF624 domain-containing protein [Lachnospiraceae bacterium]|nr:DUF624 domain-containing protein [Lachnospiraceae bacterium]